MDIPIKDYAKNTALFWTNPYENAKTLIEGSNFIKNRWAEGYDRDVMRVFQDADQDGFFSRLLDLGMSFGKTGDIIPIFIGGWSVYKYHLDKGLAAGMTEDAAKKEAIKQFEMTTERTQQAGHIKDLGMYQSGGSVARLFTMFLTSPRQYFISMSESILDAAAGKPGAVKQAAKKFVIAQIVLPSLFEAAGQMMLHGLDPEEWELDDFISAWITGPLNGLFVVGSVGKRLVESAISKSKYGYQAVPLYQDLKYIEWGLRDLEKSIENDKFNAKRILSGALNISEGLSGASPAAGLISAGRRESRRWRRLLDARSPEEKKAQESIQRRLKLYEDAKGKAETAREKRNLRLRRKRLMRDARRAGIEIEI
jgi:hypothetical protein